MLKVRSGLSGIVGLVVLIFSLNAAGEAADALAAGRSLWRSFEYEDAIVQLQSVLSDPRASATQRLEALELMSVLHLTLRRDAQAQESFVRLLSLDPGHSLTDPGYPPRVQEFFGQARSAFIPQINLNVAPVAPSLVPDAQTLTLAANLSGDTAGIERVLAFVRTAGETNYRQALMRRSGQGFSADVPCPPQGHGMEFYLEAQAPSGYVLGRGASASEPQRIPGQQSATQPPVLPDPTQPTPLGPNTREGNGGEVDTGGTDERQWYQTWWFWTIVGVVVVGATTTGLAVGLQDDLEEGSLGSISLP